MKSRKKKVTGRKAASKGSGRIGGSVKKKSARPSPKKTSAKKGIVSLRRPEGRDAAAPRRELEKLIGVMGAEDLAVLIEQARILIHNRQVLAQYEKNRAARAARPAGGAPDGPVYVKEAEDKSYFMVTFGGYRHFFAAGEMDRLVGMCREAGGADDAAQRLYSWFERDRYDVKKNSGIAGAGDPVLKELYRNIMERYGKG